MPYASVMVYVDSAEAPEPRVRIAAELAESFKSILIGVSAVAIRPPYFTTEDIATQSALASLPAVSIGPSYSTTRNMATAGIANIELSAVSTALHDREVWFRGIVQEHGRQIEWRSAIDFPVEMLVREARAADIVVIGRNRQPGDAYDSLDPAEAVLKIGRPTLIVPDGVRSLKRDHIVVGWRDTCEARRTIQQALPLLQQATCVTVVEICGLGGRENAHKSVQDVVLYLKRHGIMVGDGEVIDKRGSSAAALIRRSRKEKADLLVTGAYGHSRLGEWAFGGVTRELLRTSPICCLMVH